ncbi:FidL-like protein [Sodalis sp. RH22]|uniref:FidL-like protein n=1 Tax=unclassified Sodalis (in: enterobacteria) TaxID=2636512 RepID=UPI0039B3D220
MKRIWLILALLLLSLTLFYRSHYRGGISGYQCSALMVYRSAIPAGSLTYTVEAKMFFTSPSQGFYALNGTLAHDDRLYNLHRSRFFSYRQQNQQGLYEITITREIVSTLDNAPNGIASPVLLPVGASLLPSFRRIDKNAILVSLLYSPFFICASD